MPSHVALLESIAAVRALQLQVLSLDHGLVMLLLVLRKTVSMIFQFMQVQLRIVSEVLGPTISIALAATMGLLFIVILRRLFPALCSKP